MVLVKTRVFNTNLFDPLPLSSISSAYGVLVNQHIAPAPTGLSTLLRGRAEFNLSMVVGSPTSDVPSESWWSRSDILLYAYWVPDASTGILPADAEDEKYLGSVLCQKTLVASPSAPDQYSVHYFTDEPLITKTYRKPSAEVLGPAINWYVVITDPEFVYSGAFAGVRANAYSRNFSLWGDA